MISLMNRYILDIEVIHAAGKEKSKVTLMAHKDSSYSVKPTLGGIFGGLLLHFHFERKKSWGISFSNTYYFNKIEKRKKLIPFLAFTHTKLLLRKDK